MCQFSNEKPAESPFWEITEVIRQVVHFALGKLSIGHGAAEVGDYTSNARRVHAELYLDDTVSHAFVSMLDNVIEDLC
jgi:hypothetical protein